VLVRVVKLSCIISGLVGVYFMTWRAEKDYRAYTLHNNNVRYQRPESVFKTIIPAMTTPGALSDFR
jgi:hypothetical protein